MSISTPSIDDDLAPDPQDERWERRPWRSLLVSVLRPLGAMAIVAAGLLRRTLQDWLAGETVEVGLLTVAGLIALAVSVLLAVHQMLVWRRFRWSVTSDGLHTRQGGLSRVATTYAASRIDGVDIDEPVLERLVGLCTVKVEVSGGADSSAELVGLPRARAEALRSELLALRQHSTEEGVAGSEPQELPEAPGLSEDSGPTPSHLDSPAAAPSTDALDEGVVVLALDRDRARRFLVRSPAVWLALLTVVAGLTTAVVLGVRGGWAAAVPLLVPSAAWAVGAVRLAVERWRSVATWQIRSRPDGLVITRGRLHRKRTTIRQGRVAAVQIRQGPVLRGGEWWEVTASVTAFGSSLSDESSSTVCAVATTQEVADLLPHLLPDLDPTASAELVGSMNAAAPPTTWDRPRRAARRFSPWGWRFHGLWVGPSHVLTRGGRWRRTIRMLDRTRIQTVGLDAGPLVRRLSMAHLQVRLPMGPTRTTTIGYLDAGRAAELLSVLAVERERTIDLAQSRG